ncbi:MAG: glycosyltransferase family 2 protein [Candidatus Sericytochromatia bacterium]
MFSVIIPCYRSPQYLAICLASAFAGAQSENEYVVVLDGHGELYEAVLRPFAERIQVIRFSRNQGLCHALNQGVWQARFSRLLLVNEDNVFPKDWDRRLALDWREDRVLSVQQIEPQGPSAYDFVIRSFGETAQNFDLQGFQDWEITQARPQLLPDGRIFPVALSKRVYMSVGGFDPIYPSPHYCDFDFFLKLELRPELTFARTCRLHLYHFGGKSTQQQDGNPAEQAAARQHFDALADRARRIFEQKWGIAAVRGPDHSLLPRVRYQHGVRYQARHEDLRVATIVNFCTNEARLIDTCLREALRFSSQVIVPVCDHFFDGKPEDLTLIRHISERHPEVHFAGFAFDTRPRPQWYWPSLARVVGLRQLQEDIDWVLFLDADEIAEGERLHAWLQSGRFRQFGAMTLANWWYFREARWQAETLEDSAVLIARSQLDEARMMDPMERIAIFEGASGPHQRGLLGLDGQPLVHHYSWVRTRSEMLRKVQSWSHREDRDWVALVESEFSGPFRGRDFVHGYRFREVVPFWRDEAQF